jgi:hypothetical protein
MRGHRHSDDGDRPNAEWGSTAGIPHRHILEGGNQILTIEPGLIWLPAFGGRRCGVAATTGSRISSKAPCGMAPEATSAASNSSAACA